MENVRDHGPPHAAIVLAAGASTRLGQAKQLVEIDGEPQLRRVTRYALATRPVDCIVVLRRNAGHIEAALDGLAARILCIGDANEGMAASLRAGVAALDARCAGALVVLTDQPALGEAHLERMCAAWRDAPARAVASAYAGVIGTPALLPRSWFEAVAALRGDVGARALLRERSAQTVAIEAPELARDLDVPDDLRAFDES